MEVEPDLGSLLSPEEHEEADRVAIPVVTVERADVRLEKAMQIAGVWAALVIEGMLMRRVSIADQSVLRLLGPGDLITPAASPPSPLVADGGLRACGPGRLGLFGNEVLIAGRRFPALFVGIQRRMAEQHDRVATQLAICQLPRVRDRVLGMMWLLSESWGRVTPLGTSLPLTLTHDTIGALVGAKRSTVTLALQELIAGGAIVRQDRGWLLIEDFPSPNGPSEQVSAPSLIRSDVSVWDTGVDNIVLQAPRADLRGAVRALREDVERTSAQITVQSEAVRASRQRTLEIIDLIRARRFGDGLHHDDDA